MLLEGVVLVVAGAGLVAMFLSIVRSSLSTGCIYNRGVMIFRERDPNGFWTMISIYAFGAFIGAVFIAGRVFKLLP